VRVVDEVVAWNYDNPPDVVWCCAGSSHPGLFVDTPASVFPEQMNSNYFTSLYMAHAVLAHWAKTPEDRKKMSLRELSEKNSLLNKSNLGWTWTWTKTEEPARHLIFTASFLAFYSFTGYSPYSPAKAALRALSDSLSQEMNFYAAACPDEPRVRLHTVFPATILTESYDEENLIKPTVTKALEEGDAGQTAEVVAAKSIKALEEGQELITTDILTSLVKRSMLGGSVRGGFVAAIIDWLLAGLMAIVMVFVRCDMDRKTRKRGQLLS
jgi:3-dehydrosphinganine reductase